MSVCLSGSSNDRGAVGFLGAMGSAASLIKVEDSVMGWILPGQAVGLLLRSPLSKSASGCCGEQEQPVVLGSNLFPPS